MGVFDYVNVLTRDGRGGYFVPRDMVPLALRTLGEGSYVAEPLMDRESLIAWLRMTVEQRAMEKLVMEGDPSASPPRGIINA